MGSHGAGQISRPLLWHKVSQRSRFGAPSQIPGQQDRQPVQLPEPCLETGSTQGKDLGPRWHQLTWILSPAPSGPPPLSHIATSASQGMPAQCLGVRNLLAWTWAPGLSLVPGICRVGQWEQSCSAVSRRRRLAACAFLQPFHCLQLRSRPIFGLREKTPRVKEVRASSVLWLKVPLDNGQEEISGFLLSLQV